MCGRNWGRRHGKERTRRGAGKEDRERGRRRHPTLPSPERRRGGGPPTWGRTGRKVSCRFRGARGTRGVESRSAGRGREENNACGSGKDREAPGFRQGRGAGAGGARSRRSRPHRTGRRRKVQGTLEDFRRSGAFRAEKISGSGRLSEVGHVSPRSWLRGLFIGRSLPGALCRAFCPEGKTKPGGQSRGDGSARRASLFQAFRISGCFRGALAAVPSFLVFFMAVSFPPVGVPSDAASAAFSCFAA